MIKVCNIKKSYNRHSVLNGVDIICEKGKIQALMGANGAGKTTLINIISGLLRHDDGTCFIENEEVTENNYTYKTNVGYVLETPMYIESFTADEYLEFVARLHKLDENTIKLRMQELLDFFELPTQNKKYIKNFSRGMKGKVSLAASLIHNPQYLILDEPFDGLDFLTIEKIKTLLKTKAEKGATILITSHQYDIISALCDNLALLKDGIIEFNNSYDALEKQVTEESEESVKTYLEKLMRSGEKKSLNFI
jgi:ABC-type multidrug transport system, ATPase component